MPRAAPGPIVLTRALRAELEARVLARYPEEACGFLVGTREGGYARVLELVEGSNHAPDPRVGFVLAPGDLLAAWRAARAAGREVLGTWHSHPGGRAAPSREDREGAGPGWSHLIAAVDAGGTRELRSFWREGAAFREQELVDGDP